ncbi:MAG: TIGR03545 family protein [Bdellovibrionales bacterium]|nr:TIGR03545 family protein [Bdellovibrionales bacterium]
MSNTSGSDMNTTKVKTEKKPKVKGPIRWEAVIPITIIIVVVGVYFKLFFDANLRSAIEYVGTQMHGAEVNVGYVNSSFINPGIEIGNIQVTDKEEPSKNLISLKAVRFKLLGDAILRAKFVVEDASIIGIEAMSPRKRPGRVLPPKVETKGPSVMKDIEKQVYSQTRKKYSENMLGDVANILGGVDAKDQLKNIQGDLESEKRVKEMEAFVKEKEDMWNKRLEELPKPEELDALVKKAKALKLSSKDPIQTIKNLKEADKIIKEADKAIDSYKDASKNLKADFKTLEKGVKDIDDLVKADVAGLQKRFKIPSVDGKSLSESIFMSYLDTKIVGIRKYAEMARQYMPKKKDTKTLDEPIVPPKRGEGQNVKYPITVGYPLFWLKRAEISSVANENPYSGNLQGLLTDVTTAPTHIKKPAKLEVKGDFPNQKISGINAQFVVDHTTKNEKETFDIKVASFPVGTMKLSDSSDLKLAIADSQGVLNFNGGLIDNGLVVNFENFLKEPKFELNAKNKVVKEILGNVFNNLPWVSIYGYFKGSWGDLDMRVSSNFGDELAKGLKREIQAKIDAAKKQLEDFVQGRIKGERDKIQSRIKEIENKFTGKIDGEKDKLEAKLNGAKKDLKSGGGNAAKAPKEKLKKDLKKLFKGF